MADAVDLLDEQVDRLGRPVGGAGGVEVGQELGAPGPQRAAEAGDLGDWAAGQRLEDGERPPPAVLGVGRVIDRAQPLGGLPGDGDVEGRVADLQGGLEAAALPVGQGLDAAAQQPAGLLERVVLVAAVAKRLLLHPPPGFV